MHPPERRSRRAGVIAVSGVSYGIRMNRTRIAAWWIGRWVASRHGTSFGFARRRCQDRRPGCSDEHEGRTVITRIPYDSSIPAGARIGHVHLKVANLDRAISFYRDVLGFDLINHFDTAAFLSAGGYHHHIGFNTWESKDGDPASQGTTGL